MLTHLPVSRPPTIAVLLLVGTFGIAAGVSPLCAQPAATAAQSGESVATDKEEEEEELFEPSNTGYIDSAILRSRFRIRYDSAFDGDRPDRAEFIYGKCRCFTLAAGQDAASRGPTADLDYQEIEVTYEQTLKARWSVFLEVPFRSIELTLPEGFVAPGLYNAPVFDDSGLSDVRAGVKYGIVATENRHLTFQLRAYFPTGEALENLGTDHASMEPALLYYKRFPNRWTLESELRWWAPLGGSSDPITGASNPDSPVGRTENAGDPPVGNDDFAGDVVRFGIGASREVRGGSVRWSPVVELVGWYAVDGYSTPPTPLAEGVATPRGYIAEADGDSIVNLKLGARFRVRDSGSVYVGWGLALTEDVWYDDIFRLEYRRSF